MRNISISARGKQILSRALPRWRAMQAKLAVQFGEDNFQATVDLMKKMTQAGEALLIDSNP